MTLILKSNVRATNNVGNIHGHIGPSDYVAMLDFARDEYYTNIGGVRQDYALDQAVDVARSSVGPYRLRDGVLRTAPGNTPRRHYMESYDTEGLYVAGKRTNLAQQAGSHSLTIDSGSTNQRIVLSYRGGTADLAAPELAFEEEWQDGGVIVKSYVRSVSTPFPAALTSSSASEVQVVLAVGGTSAAPFIGYGSTVAEETVSLKPPFKSLLAGGSGTVIARFVLPTAGSIDLRRFSPIAVQSASPNGGIYATTSRSKGGSGTDNVRTLPDGSGVVAGTSLVALNGSYRQSFTVGLSFEDRGDVAKLISYGQLDKSSGNGANIFGPPAEIYIGGEGSISALPSRLDGAVTHCVIYDRILTDDEALIIASQWL